MNRNVRTKTTFRFYSLLILSLFIESAVGNEPRTPSPLAREYADVFEQIQRRERSFDERSVVPNVERLLKNATPDFFVATNGDDSWSGKLAEPNAERTDGPFASLTKARDSVRELLNNRPTSNDANAEKPDAKPILVVVRGGVYELTAPFELNEQDGGTPTSPVVWKAADGEEVRLVGGKYLNDLFSLADAAKNDSSAENQNYSEIFDRIQPAVRDKIVACDLKAAGISDFGSPAGRGAEIFYNEIPLRLSRYPNDGFLKIKSLTTEGTTPIDVRGTKGIAQGNFQFDDERLLTWSDEKDLWVHGYWFWDWAEQRHKVESIDPTTKTLKVAPPFHSYGYRTGQWFYAFNILSEIDAPGEFYIDRDAGILYFYPPKTDGENAGQNGKNADKTDDAQPSVAISVLTNVVQMKNVSNLAFCGFVLEIARGDALTMNGGTGNLIYNCVVQNNGGTGISASGSDHEIFGCRLFNCGGGGINMNGGDRTTLTPAWNRVVNNRIYDFGRIQRVYASGIQIGGVGNYIGYNEIFDAPHMAIGFGGNDHLIEFNEISNVCFESNDAGAIYTGRNWTTRGTILCFNYLHDITGFENRGCVGIYFDDMFSSADIVGNLFANVTRAAFIGGGRDCGVYNNIFVDCQPALHIDARALGWARYHADEWLAEAKEKGTISGIKWNEPPYSTKYPKLASILDEGKTPKAPEGNYIAQNICVAGTWDLNKQGQWQGETVEKAARPYLTFEENLILTENAVDPPTFSNDVFLKKDDVPAKQNDAESVPNAQNAQNVQNVQNIWNVGKSPNETTAASWERVFVDPRNGDYRLLIDPTFLPNDFYPLPFDKIGNFNF